MAEVVNTKNVPAWILEDGHSADEEVDFDVTLRSVEPKVLPDVRVALSTSEQLLQLAIGNSSFELWWRTDEEGWAKLEALRDVLIAISDGRYRENVVMVPGGRVVHGELGLPGETVQMATHFPS